MELKEIRQLIKMLDGTDVSEIELTREGSTLRIARSIGGGEVVPMVTQTMVPAAPAAPVVQAAAPVAAAAPEANKDYGNLKPVVSPMVGTFYRASSPESPMFVQEGDMVKKGQVICIIEAMKLMNEIEAEFAGKVVQALKDNASPVEYGEELFLIEPA
ncbi:MAG: acetyl-CoA carboxylase biotin carboxyl carrier protein [Magnetococcales bacterium]|nr:acetyl-CoA carboxylase biotin carboxyl carrier protein [Magnetococcales bacterium]